MDRERLRGRPGSAQGALRGRARRRSRHPLRARELLGEGVSCSVQTGRALAEAGLHPASGGDGTQLCSGDMLLEALAACAGVTLRAVATSLGIEVRGGQRPRRGRPRLPRHAGRRPRRAGRVLGDPPRVRSRHRGVRRGAGDPAEADRALLRRLPDLASPPQLEATVAGTGMTAPRAQPAAAHRGAGEGAGDEALERARTTARPWPSWRRARWSWPAGLEVEWLGRLRLPAHLRGADDLRRPLPLAGAAAQPAAAPPDAARPGGARPLRQGAGRGRRRAGRPHPLRPRGRRAGDRPPLRLQGLRLGLAGRR